MRVAGEVEVEAEVGVESEIDVGVEVAVGFGVEAEVGVVVEVPAGVDDGSSASPNADDILMMLTPMPFHKQSHVGNGFGTDLHTPSGD